jgi:hypothetical protein
VSVLVDEVLCLLSSLDDLLTYPKGSASETLEGSCSQSFIASPLKVQPALLLRGIVGRRFRGKVRILSVSSWWFVFWFWFGG